jgi:DNA-binding XRE family transcriptional regulator
MVFEKVTLPIARKMAKLTQKSLAEKVGVSESTVFNWENGKTEPTVSQAMLIAEVCERPLDSIIFLTSDTV